MSTEKHVEGLTSPDSSLITSNGSEDSYQRMVENANEAILVAQDFKLRFVNRKAAELIGYQKEDLISKPFADFIHPDDQAKVLENYMKRIQGREAMPAYPCRIFDGKGEVRWFEINATLFSWQGRPATLITMPEITKRKAAEEALRASEENYRQLVQSANSIILRRDIKGRITFLNAYAQKFFGYSEDEIRGKNIIGTILPEKDSQGNDLAGMIKDIGQDPERYVTQETESIRRNGERVWILWTNKGIHDSQGRMSEILSIGNDITAQRNLEEQLRHSQKMEAFGRLAGGIAHDFNNLLTAIAGYSEMILMELREGHHLHNHAKQIKLAGERAASLTQQLLALGKKQTVRTQAIDLNKEVSRMNRMLRRLIEEDIELVEDLDPNIGHVMINANEMGHLILNLVINARDAMPKGGRLTLQTAHVVLNEEEALEIGDVKAGAYVLLVVSDTGSGMNAKTRKRMFEPFFTTKGKGHGTGLGLSTVYGIVKQGGGAIQVDSEPTNGTTMQIYLPRVIERLEKDEKSILAVAPPVDSKETVLLVEDEGMIRDLLREALKKSGYTVLAAQNGGDAIAICKKHKGPIHLIVTDVVMPKMSGCELVERLSTMRPKMKVLYISGYTKGTTVHQIQSDSDVEYVEKPFSTSFLVHKIQEVLNRSITASA